MGLLLRIAGTPSYMGSAYINHTRGTKMGRGGYVTLTPIQIYDTMGAQYGVPGAQEEEDVLG